MATSNPTLLKQFQSLTTTNELLSLIQKGSDKYKLPALEMKDLEVWLSGVNRRRYYDTFYIAKRSGGSREISSPKLRLKTVQHIIAQALTEGYRPRASVHGYAKGKSIVSNATNHDNQKWVLRVDLKDFFHTIHYGRVRGVLLNKPFSFHLEVATALSTLCTYPASRYETILPQGAPTSPIISNLVCRRLDFELMQLAQRYRCWYSRYADDIIFSTNNRAFPTDLAVLNGASAHLGLALRELIESHDLHINEDKVSLRYRSARQLVTGLVVNKKVNVPREKILEVKAMLHSWEYKGLSETAQRFHEEFDKRNRAPGLAEPSFKRVVKGRIEFIGYVKGYADPVYLKLAKKLSELDDTYIFDKRNQRIVANEVAIFTEGVTDRKHLEAALRFFKEKGEFSSLTLDLRNETRVEGHDYLLAACKGLSEYPQNKALVFLFDRDSLPIIKQVQGQTDLYKDWGNNVFSLPLPLIAHREGTTSFCIEHYFLNDELARKDVNGRRIYLREEFNEETGRHITEPVYRTNPKNKTLVVDDNVFDFLSGNNVALSKSGFADAVLNREPPFDDLNFEAFRALFATLEAIFNKATFQS